MNTKLSTLLLSVIFGLTACSVDDTSITPSDNPDDISWEKPDYTSVKCDDPVFISDGIKPEVRSALDTYLTNITSLDEAMVAVVKPEDIGTYEGKLKAFYDRGGLVVVAHPTTRPSMHSLPRSLPRRSTITSPSCSRPTTRGPSADSCNSCNS